MKLGRPRLKPSLWFLSAVCLSGFMAPESGRADKVTACMSKMIEQASDATTIGELRASCAAQSAEKASTGQQQLSAIDVRLERDRENVLKPFTLMPHKPNYMLLGAYNFDGYDAELSRLHFNDPERQFDDIEAQFQISLKIPLGINVFHSFDVYAAYTNRSFWQVFNSEISSPFRETNHEPEAWIQFTPGREFLGFTNSANILGIVHQSNGRGGVLSRSWNRVYANFVFQRGNFVLGFKPWIRISEDSATDDNPDITHYLGHAELRAAYKWNKHVFSLMSRNQLESGFDRGALELGWSFPLGSYPYMKAYIQYFRGYGESLIDYNQHVNRIGIGVSLTDWL